MDFLIIDGDVYYVLDGGANEGEPEIIGESKGAIDGTLRSDESSAKGQYRFSLEPMAEADWQTLRTKIFAGDFVDCSGEAIVAASYQLRLNDAGYTIDHDALSFRRAVQITLRQV